MEYEDTEPEKGVVYYHNVVLAMLEQFCMLPTQSL